VRKRVDGLPDGEVCIRDCYRIIGSAVLIVDAASAREDRDGRPTSERPWIATGPPPTPTTLRLSTRFTERMRCSSTRSPASASAAGGTFRPLALLNRIGSVFTVRRMLGTADLWITELVIAYDARPSYTVSIMEFRDGQAARETQYFGDPFEPGPSRAQWVERMR
jgi:hypothetical protein